MLMVRVGGGSVCVVGRGVMNANVRMIGDILNHLQLVAISQLNVTFETTNH